MPIIRGAGEKRDPIPAGRHILTLREVKPHISDDPWHPVEDPETGGQMPAKKEQLIWIFESQAKAQDGRPYEYAQFTGLFYGDPRANLTSLLDMLLPDASEEQKRGLDTDTLIGTRYEAQIGMVKNQKGNTVPKALFFMPATGAGKEAPAPVATAPASMGIPDPVQVERVQGLIKVALSTPGGSEERKRLETAKVALALLGHADVTLGDIARLSPADLAETERLLLGGASEVPA